MPTRPSWKFLEDRLARFFGTVRRPLSGGNSKTGRDDSLHSTLFLEAKQTARSSLWTLYRDTKEKADKEKRTPVIGIQEKRAKGILLCFLSTDFAKVAKAWAEANGFDLIPKKKTAIRKANKTHRTA